MKLKQLKNGDNFTLARNNEHYNLIGSCPYHGGNFMVKKIDCDEGVTRLNGQCEVEVIEQSKGA